MKNRIGIKRVLLCCSLFFCFLFLSGCQPAVDSTEETGETVGDVKFFRKISSEMHDQTGWYYTFMMEGLKDDPSQRIYNYIVMNLRYRYRGDYWSVSYMQHINDDNTVSYTRVKAKSGIMIFGRGGEAEIRDRAILNSFLNKESDPEALLALNPDDYTFEVLDKDIFFRLMKTALEGEDAPESIYVKDWERAMHGMYVEQFFQDGYRFQIGMAMNNTAINEIYIDVLYQTGEAYDAYEQLSDLVDEGRADEEQKEAFALIQKIREAIKSKNSFLAMSEEYQDRTIAEIDFLRLYEFLKALEDNDTMKYLSVDDVPVLEDELTEEEAIEDMKKWGLAPLE